MYITDNYYKTNIKKDSQEDIKLKCESCQKEFILCYEIIRTCGHYICNLCSKSHNKCPNTQCNKSFICSALKNKEAQIKNVNGLIGGDYKATEINQKNYIR